MNLQVTKRGFYYMLARLNDEFLPPICHTDFYKLQGRGVKDYILEWRTRKRGRCIADLTFIGGTAMLTIRCASSHRIFWPDEELLRRCGLTGEEGAECK